MKKPKPIKKLKSIKVPSAVKPPFLRPSKTAEEKVSDALSNVPRITNDTVSDHREEVLSSARKYIYPLQHSKYHLVRISLVLLLAVIIGFFAVMGLELYKFQATDNFTYDVTRIVPFPVAKVGGSWISYESYLFELRHNIHYYKTQQQADFSTKDGKSQLQRLKQQAMNQVIQDAYVKELASKNHVSVSNQAVDNEVTLVKSQNHLGSNDRAFNEALSQFYGWSQSDFKRELKQEMLAQAVATKLDKSTSAQAQAAFNQIMGGADFAKVAAVSSDDAATKANGGQYSSAITTTTTGLPPAVIAEIFKLEPGGTSTIINTGYTLEIVKVLSVNGNSRTAAHIQFTLTPITNYTKPLQTSQPAHLYISF